MIKQIIIYTTNTCVYCGMVKKFLQTKGQNYEEVNLDEHPERQKEAYELTGQLTVPITLVVKDNDKKDVIVGYNLSKLAAAIN